jgi:Heterokaryon incompatibility protein (HET)
MGKRKRDEDPQLEVDHVLRYDVEKMAFEQDAVDEEALVYEQSIMDEIVGEQSKLDEGLTKRNEHWEAEEALIIHEIRLLKNESDNMEEMMREDFMRDEKLVHDEWDRMNYLEGYMDKMQSIMNEMTSGYMEDEEHEILPRRNEAWRTMKEEWEHEDLIYYGSYEMTEKWATEETLAMDEEALRFMMDMDMDMDLESVDELVMAKEELIMDELLLMDELLMANEALMVYEQDAEVEMSTNYEQEILDEMRGDQLGWYLITPRRNKQPSLFNYTSLGQPEHEIRVVRLHPGPRRTECPIVCDLIAIDLTTAPSYEALSYEWGSSSSKKHTIRLNEKIFAVRENLWRALYYLRDAREPRNLWIDALCINQDGVHERNCQVSRMGDIYSQAARVVAWIGEDDREARKGYAFLSELASCSIERYCPPGGNCQRWQHRSKWAALNSLCMRSYWSRLWIIQEVLLASDLLVQCGPLSIQWEELSNVFHYLRENSTGFCSPGPKLSIVSSIPFRLEIWRKEHRIAVFTDTDHHLVPLHHLVELFEDSLCFDIRDKIFGLRSLSLSCCKDFVRPDYSMAYEEVIRTLSVHHDTMHSGPWAEHPYSTYLDLLRKI